MIQEAGNIADFLFHSCFKEILEAEVTWKLFHIWFLQFHPNKFPNCGEGEDVVGVHTVLSGVVQVFHEHLVGEEGEKEEEKGR